MILKNQFRYQYENAVVDVLAKVAIGAAGAPTKDPLYSKGITSITRGTAGRYTVVFDEKFFALLNANVFQMAAAAEDLTFQLVSFVVATKTAVFICKAAAVETDPSSGSTLFLKFSFKNSSV